MINWFDMPAEGLSNGGLFEVKELEVTENGTYETKGEMYNKVVVNVEGGGGSSDFSTAQVTVVNELTETFLKTHLPILQSDTIRTDIMIEEVGTTVFTIALYKGSAIVDYGDAGDVLPVVEATGNATVQLEGYITITGDCTLTYSAGLLP